MALLEKLDSPEELRKLPESRLTELAAELRAFILASVRRSGGHLATNLGTVELTVAIHCAFNTPQDKLIWDVGHQAYAHKVLTGRRDSFGTLRQWGGISGFTRRTESPYDTFGAGHASTSLAAGIGVKAGQELSNSQDYTIVVIGDGAMTGGMALEGLNNAHAVKEKFIVVLNDNGMSISPNVGTLSRYLTLLRTRPTLRRIKELIGEGTLRIPKAGRFLYQILDRIKEAGLLIFNPYPEARLFEVFGFSYLGPFDGHNIPSLLQAFTSAKRLKGPILIHVVTKKGKGCPEAEEEPVKYHGVSPKREPASSPALVEGRLSNGVDQPLSSREKILSEKERKSVDASLSTDKSQPESKKNTPPTFTSVFAKTLVEIAKRDPDVVTITAAMEDGTGLKIFKEAIPDRFFDVGIAEQFAVTFAGGLAVSGKYPVCAIYSTFLQRAYDQIIHDICIQKLPVLFAIDRAGIVGEDGETHQGMFDIGYLRILPNITLMMPRDERVLRDMLHFAVGRRLLAAIRYPRGEGVGVEMSQEPGEIEMGKGEIVWQPNGECRAAKSEGYQEQPLRVTEGIECVLIGVGPIIYRLIEVAERLQERGLRSVVIDPRFIKPMDEELILEWATKCGKVLVAEEASRIGSFGSALLELLSDRGLRDIIVKRIGLPDSFLPHGSPEKLRSVYGLDPPALLEAALELLTTPKTGHHAEDREEKRSLRE